MTTMVLSILSLLTRPCLMRRRLARSATSAVPTMLGCSMTRLVLSHVILSLSKSHVILSLSKGLLGDRSLNLGVGAADELHAGEVAQVSGAQREAQVEELFLRLAGTLLEVRQGQFAQAAQIVAFHQIATSASCSVRVTILVEIGSFCAASRSALRAASICRLVIHTGASACRPNSPNVSVLPTSALPRMRPRCWRRHFTRFGVSIATGPRWSCRVGVPYRPELAEPRAQGASRSAPSRARPDALARRWCAVTRDSLARSRSSRPRRAARRARASPHRCAAPWRDARPPNRRR